MNLVGLYRGTVVNNMDPMAAGRLQVQVPAMGGNSTMWAERCVSFLGAQQAATRVGVGTTVWVAFEGGNPNHPVVLGVKP